MGAKKIDGNSLRPAKATAPGSVGESSPAALDRALDALAPWPLREVPEALAQTLRQHIRVQQSAHAARAERVRSRTIHSLARRLVFGEDSVQKVLQSLEWERSQAGGHKVDAEFFKALGELSRLWMKPWDRYQIKKAFCQRVAPDLKENMQPALAPLRKKYGEQAVNLGVAEEMLRYANRMNPSQEPEREAQGAASYTLKRPGVETDIIDLGQACIEALARQAATLGPEQIQARLRSMLQLYSADFVETRFRQALAKGDN